MKKKLIILLLFLFLTGCSDTDDIDKRVTDIETELSSLTDDMLVITSDFENFDSDDLLSEVDALYIRLTTLEDDLNGLSTVYVEDIEDELEALKTAFDTLAIKVTQLENDSILSDKIALLETLVDELTKGNTLSEDDINYIIGNYSTITQGNLGFRFFDNFDNEAYTKTCTDFMYGVLHYDYCYDTTPALNFKDSSFSTVLNNIINLQLNLEYLDTLLDNISNYDKSPLIVGQNFEIDNYVITSVESNDTSLLFSASEDNITDDYKVVIAKDEVQEILLLEAIVYDVIPANNKRIRILLDYDYNLLEIQLQDGVDLYYYTNYNDVQEFHFFVGYESWNSVIQDSTNYVTTRMEDIGTGSEILRVATFNDDGLILMFDNHSTDMFYIHHTAFSNIEKIALAYDNTSSEYIEYIDSSELQQFVDIASDTIHMSLIPGQDHYITGDTITTETIRTILFYSTIINIDSIESDYDIIFKFDKTESLNLLNTYLDNPDYALDLPFIEMVSYDVYYRGFLLDD